VSYRLTVLAGVTATPLLLSTSCLSLPSYQPDIAVMYKEDDSGSTVSGSGFSLHFAGGPGPRFPDALHVDGVDILGHAPAATCFGESEAGIGLEPSPRISPDSDVDLARSDLRITLRGPAVVQAEVTWATRLSCNADHEPQGTATFTVFPDGRIVRHDSFVDDASEQLSPIACACDGRLAWFTISSYWSFTRSTFSSLNVPNQEGLLVPDDGMEASNLPVACLASGNYQLSSGWRDQKSSTIHRVGDLLAVGRYGLFKSNTLYNFRWASSAALLVDRSDCKTGLIRAGEYAAPSPLTVTSATTPVAQSELDGIYGGDAGSGAPGIELSDMRTELRGPVKSSFAVWLRFPRASEAVRATLTSDAGDRAAGVWYLPQQTDERSWILWFRDPLLANQTILVEPF